MHIFFGDPNEGSTWESYCKGEGTINGLTFEEFVISEGERAAERIIEMGYGDIVIKDGDIYKFNPIMQTQEVEELEICTSYFISLGFTFDEGSDVVSFCQGTGTTENLSFQEFIDWNFQGIDALKAPNVIIQDGDKYIPNPVMLTQTFEGFELANCTYNGDIAGTGELYFDETSSRYSYCKGEGTTSDGKTFQEYLDGLSIGAPGTQESLTFDVILVDDLPEVEYSYTNLIVNPNMEGEVLESCKTIVDDLLASTTTRYALAPDTQSSSENFCKGIGHLSTRNWNKTIGDLATDTEFLKGDGHQLLRSGVVLAKIENLPYFEFTISGKNTYSKKDIYYDVVLTHGDNHETRTERIRDDLLRFTLTEVEDNDGEKTLVNGITLYDIKNGERLYVETIPKNTMEEINKTYRLYMNISESTVICGGEVSESCDYYTDTDKSPNWNDVFASVKVSVTGDFNNKELTPYLVNVFKNNAFNHSDTILTDTDGTIYLSGSNETYYKYPSGVMQSTEKIIDYNYVLYSGILWRITAIYPDGTLKLVTENTIGDRIQWGGDGKFINSNVYTYLNNDFLNTLDNYENVIVEDYKWNVAEFVTSEEIGESEYVTAPVGLINSYEYWNSYQNVSTDCSLSRCDGYYKSYLADYQSNSWWLLNNKKDSFYGYLYGFVSNVNDEPYAALDTGTYAFVRPSIVLKPNVLTSGGDGSYNSPFIVGLVS